MTDSAARRLKMVDTQVRTEDVTDYAILDAMTEVPRERFLPERLHDLAYLDEDLTLSGRGASARSLMRPAGFARLVQLAAIGEGDRILDVGTGCGYSAAILSRIGASVIALESDPELVAMARSALGDTPAVKVVAGKLAEGHAADGPYDVIVVEGGVPAVSDALLGQLAESGRLVAIVGDGAAASATIYRRSGDETAGRPAYSASARPLPGFERPKAFVF